MPAISGERILAESGSGNAACFIEDVSGPIRSHRRGQGIPLLGVADPTKVGP
jgi:hypothetical protein